MDTSENYVEKVIKETNLKERSTIYIPKHLLIMAKIYCIKNNTSLTQLIIKGLKSMKQD
jgi:hypothetical protein